MIANAKHRAKRDDLPFNITEEDIKIPETCPVLNIPLRKSIGKQGGDDNSPTLDRVVGDLGYVKGNVYVISLRANKLKSDGNAWELMKVAEYAEDFVINKLMKDK